MALNVGSGLGNAVGVAFDAETPNRCYVWERTGKIWVVENGVRQQDPLLDISDEVGCWHDHGMLGFALHPNFHQNGYIYLFYTVDRYHLLNAGMPGYDPTADLYDAPSIARITRYTVNTANGFNSIDPASRKILIGTTKSTGFPVVFTSHGVGSLLFGADGSLLATFGDSANFAGIDDGIRANQSYADDAVQEGIITARENVGAFRSQLLSSLCGKLVRIDPETGNGLPSNPFYEAAHPSSNQSRVWALGLRNAYRMTLRPDTGSHNPDDANPGEIVLGDVGMGTWEEIDVIDRPGLNCGWPIFEGLTVHPDYIDSAAQNQDAPNPLGGYFKFKDLIVQETLGIPSWPNPKNTALQVPASIPHFMHHRPILDMGRIFNAPCPVRTGIFQGNNAAEIQIDNQNSPVSGPLFQALASTGGTFYSGTAFPATYRNTYFHADYDQSWIRNLVFDENHRLIQVRNFATVFHPVFMTTHPTDGSLYYVSLGVGVKQLVYAPGGNRPPIAAAAADVTIGASPLAVNFSSAGSKDPDGQPLSYLWDFGDGTTSTEANPAKVYAVTGTHVYTAKLTVTDAGNATAEATMKVFVNHSLPQVQMISPTDGAKYPLDATVPFSLLRSVTEVNGHPTTTRWDIFLHHNSHEHTETPVTTAEGTTMIVPAYGDGATYYYRVVLTVTDDIGATVQQEARIYPNESNAAPAAAWSTPSTTANTGSSLTILDPNATITDADSVQLDFGELTVQITGGGSSDVLGLVPEGNGPGQIDVSGTSVLFEGHVIGVLSGGTNGQALTITFNSIPTPAIAQAILRRVGASYMFNGTRTVTVTIDDGDGGASPVATLEVTVAGTTNQMPTVALTSPAENASFLSKHAITLTADASDPDGTIARVEFYAGATKIGEDTTAPYSLTWNDAAAGSYTLTARAIDNFGASTDSAGVQVGVTLDDILPAGWTAADLGAVSAAGSTDYIEGTYTLSASGAGLATAKDEFHFLSQPWTGDGQITARIASLNGINANSFGGVMFREKATPNSRYALLKLSDKGLALQQRATVGQPLVLKAGPVVAAPRWLRLVRHGLRFTAYTSVDGVQWQQVVSAAGTMGKSIFVGLAASAQADGQIATAVFDHVTIEALPAAPNPPVVTVAAPTSGATFTVPVNLSIDTPATDIDGGIARVELYNGTKKLAIDTKAPFAFSWSVTKPAVLSLTARAYDFAGLKTTSTPVAINVHAAPLTFTAPWGSRDIGPTFAPGAATENTEVYTLSSLGLGLGATSDQGRLVYRSFTGGGTFIAHLASLSDANPAAHAGLMFRETLGTTARYAAVVVTNQQGSFLQSRSAPAGKAVKLTGPSVAAPQWLKLVRKGSVFTASVSADGSNWTAIGSRTIAMASPMYAVFFVGAADLEEPATAIFDTASLAKP